jgi:uncharacterized protein YjbJ (UPF0337 family)
VRAKLCLRISHLSRISERGAISGVISYAHKKQAMNMDREHVKGAADKAKGAIKDAAGRITSDEEFQAEGKFDKAKGAAHNVAGDVKDAARRASKHD